MNTSQKLALGGIAGTLATAPMTMAMAALKKQLPDEQQYPLPPRLITENIAKSTGTDAIVATEERAETATLLSHFGYGAAVGSLYGAFVQKPSEHSLAESAVRGAVFGLGVWAASYLGWLPAAGVLRSATKIPAERNMLMIATHLVFGSSLGVAAEVLRRDVRTTMARVEPLFCRYSAY